MDKKIRFVKAESEKELRQLAELANEIWHEFFPGIITVGQVDYMVEKFQSYPAMVRQLQDGYEYYQFRLDGRTVGYTGIHPEDGKLFLSKLYLKKEYRGLGLASQAFDFLERYCKERGLKAIWLTVNRHNDHSIRVYEKKGFVTVREQAADIGQGYVMDDYVMEKPIG